MTTDNRTNELTPEQVEAAAKAIEKIPHIVWNSPTRQDAMTLARAALAAAQGAAPQAETYEHCCNHPKCPGGSLCCCVSEQRLRDCWNQWLLEIAGDTKQAFRDGYQAGQNDPAPWLAAPVLPSSGVDEDDCWHEANCMCIRAGNVDEDKLAEAWEAGCLAGKNRKHHTNMTEEQAEKAWPNPYRARQEDSRG